MPTPTYTSLATVTLASSTGTITFSNIPNTYRDLIVVANYTTSPDSASEVRFNGDTGSNYSTVSMRGAGGSAFSIAFTSTNINPSNSTGEAANTRNFYTLQIMDYARTDKHKAVLTRMNNSNHVQTQANRWANTNAITSISIYSATFLTGSTFNLYGVIA